MPEVDRTRLVLYLALGLVVCVLGVRYLRDQGALPASGGAAVSAGPAGAGRGEAAGSGSGAGGGAGEGGVRVEQAGGGRVTVHVAGEVRRPGLYRLPAGARIDDALSRAGGPRARADLAAVNLAAKLEDGRQVLVPRRGAAPPGAAPGGGGTGAGAAAGAAGGPPAQPVNLNTATIEQLDTLDGVGPGIAQRILDYREEHGGFSNVGELAQVPGIGPKRMETLRPLVGV